MATKAYQEMRARLEKRPLFFFPQSPLCRCASCAQDGKGKRMSAREVWNGLWTCGACGFDPHRSSFTPYR